MIALPPWVQTVSTIATPPSTDVTLPVTVSSSSGTPIPRNCTFRRRSDAGPPPASVTARAICAIV